MLNGWYEIAYLLVHDWVNQQRLGDISNELGVDIRISDPIVQQLTDSALVLIQGKGNLIRH